MVITLPQSQPHAWPPAHCKKPCHDCPFRADNPVYQSPDDLAGNLRATLIDRLPPSCHHGLMAAGGGQEKPLADRKLVVCAGGLLFMRHHGIDPLPSLDVAGADRVYATAGDMAVAVANVRTKLARCVNWWSIQPAHVRLKWLHSFDGGKA